MKQSAAKLLCAAMCCISSGLHAAPANSVQKAAAQAAATSWLAILDTGDYGKAASGMADEVFAMMNWPTREDKVHGATMLLDPIKRKGEYGSAPVVTRTLQPDGVKQVTSCNCGIRDGAFYTFAYDVKYTWDDRRFHIQRHRDGTDVVYMLLEPDGEWKPASVASQFGH